MRVQYIGDSFTGHFRVNRGEFEQENYMKIGTNLSFGTTISFRDYTSWLRGT